jgi:hypothetical protein
MLPREKSGEQMHVGANKYDNVQNVIEQGRIESQRMLIDRYQRGVNNQDQNSQMRGDKH